MNERKCPACGATVQENTAKCPDCGLDGLNLRFLSKAGYEKWVKEVLKPYKATLPLKVFAGRSHGLILSGTGDLYGIGWNGSGEIEENGAKEYKHPHLMAEDVISAAAGRAYSIYVTRDSKVHLRGKGTAATQFPGFDGAKAVYASQLDRFRIVDENDQVWSYDEVQSGEDHVYRLVPCPECQWMNHTPHRIGSEPVRLKKESALTFKKLAVGPMQYPSLFLLENGTVVWKGEGKLEWIAQPVVDIGVGSNIFMFACANGDILWHRYSLGFDIFGCILGAKTLESIEHSLRNGEMNICRLPEDT